MPTVRELNVLFNNRAAIGGFNESGLLLGYYWSASQYHGYGTVIFRSLRVVR